MTNDELAQGLLAAVRAQDFGSTADSRTGGAAVKHFPSIDLAVAAFPARGPALCANVLFSREHPRGLVAQFDGAAGAVRNIHYLADQRDAQMNSFVWWPESDWSAINWRTLYGSGAQRVVAPYPASLLKMMVAVGVAMAVDARLTPWPEAAMQAMITVSDNDATTEMVALLHRLRLVDSLHDRFKACGLHTLRLDGTREDGGWGNGAGAGVGMIQMTAWDSARLMWLLDAEAPRAPWLANDAQLVSAASRERLRAWLEAQQLNEILSSSKLVGLPGWVSGLPSHLRFAHKTGTTENYASDAGIVRARPPLQRHYIVALLTNLGTRYAPHADCATTWRLPALGAAVDTLLAPVLESLAS